MKNLLIACSLLLSAVALAGEAELRAALPGIFAIAPLTSATKDF